MLKPSLRALGVASALTIGALFVAPSASAGLLDGGGLLPTSGLGNLGNLDALDGLGGLTGFLGGGETPLPLPALEDGPELPVLSGADGTFGGIGGGAFEAIGGTTLACDAAIPQLLGAFGDAGLRSSACGLNPFENGIIGLLGSL